LVNSSSTSPQFIAGPEIYRRVIIRSIQQLTGYEALVRSTAGDDFSVGLLLHEFEAHITSVETVPFTILFWEQMASITASAPQLDVDYPIVFISTPMFRAPQAALTGITLVSLHVLVHTQFFEEISKINQFQLLTTLIIKFMHPPLHDEERFLEPINLDSLTLFVVTASGDDLGVPSVFRYLGFSTLGPKCAIRLQSITPIDLVHLDNLFLVNENCDITITGRLGFPSTSNIMSHASMVEFDFVPPWEIFLRNKLPVLLLISINSPDEYDLFLEILRILLEMGYDSTLLIRLISVGEEWGDYLVGTNEENSQTYWEVVLEQCMELEENHIFVMNEAEWKDFEARDEM
jgi:hypothetical protein